MPLQSLLLAWKEATEAAFGRNIDCTNCHAQVFPLFSVALW